MPFPSRIAARLLLCCAVSAAPTLAPAQQSAAPKPAVGTRQATSAVYGKLLSTFEKEFLDAAEAMPDDKFNFSPSQGEFKGVRSFGEQVKHVAVANAYFFHDPNKPMADMKERQDSINKLTTKAEIIQALKD